MSQIGHSGLILKHNTQSSLAVLSSYMKYYERSVLETLKRRMDTNTNNYQIHITLQRCHQHTSFKTHHFSWMYQYWYAKFCHPIWISKGEMLQKPLFGWTTPFHWAGGLKGSLILHFKFYIIHYLAIWLWCSNVRSYVPH